MSGPLSASKPYPSAEGISPDAYSLRIISPAYASPTGELNAILQYIYHSFYFEKYGFHDIAETLKSIAMAEMRHLDLLGETILALGAPPVFCRFPYYGFDYYSAKYVAYSRSLKFMLEDRCSVVVRPSGTEPKLKVYVSVAAESRQEAELAEREIVKDLDF